MEDVLELYAEPYDPARPVVGFDEASKELHGEVNPPLPARARATRRARTTSTPAGTANVSLVVEPLAGRRHLAVTERRTDPVDFGAQMKHLCDELYPEAGGDPGGAGQPEYPRPGLAVRGLRPGGGPSPDASGWSSTTPRGTRAG